MSKAPIPIQDISELPWPRDYAQELFGENVYQAYLTGFSHGGATSYRFAYGWRPWTSTLAIAALTRLVRRPKPGDGQGPECGTPAIVTAQSSRNRFGQNSADAYASGFFEGSLVLRLGQRKWHASLIARSHRKLKSFLGVRATPVSRSTAVRLDPVPHKQPPSCQDYGEPPRET